MVNKPLVKTVRHSSSDFCTGNDILLSLSLLLEDEDENKAPRNGIPEILLIAVREYGRMLLLKAVDAAMAGLRWMLFVNVDSDLLKAVVVLSPFIPAKAVRS